jgi:hypothetical protein
MLMVMHGFDAPSLAREISVTVGTKVDFQTIQLIASGSVVQPKPPSPVHDAIGRFFNVPGDWLGLRPHEIEFVRLEKRKDQVLEYEDELLAWVKLYAPDILPNERKEEPVSA